VIRSIYIIGPTGNPVKVGFAENVTKRLMELQIGNPDQLIIHHILNFPAYATEAVESAAHQRLAPFHRRGEWFNISADEAKAVVEDVAPHAVQMARWRALRSNNVLEQLSVDNDVSPRAFESIGRFKEILASMDPKDRATTKAIEAHIRQRAGLGGWTVFNALMTSKRKMDDLFPGSLRARERALTALAGAINALCDYWRSENEAWLLDEMSKIRA
jgi:hypothetical protein